MMKFEDDLIRRFRHELRAQSDVIMVGSNTVRLDNPSLTVRHASGPNPLRVIPATLGDLPLESTILMDGNSTMVAVSERAPGENIAALRQRGADVVRAGVDKVDLGLLLSLLYRQSIRSVMVEGGATLLAALFRSRLVDRLIVQHLPVIFGGDGVPSMVGGPALASLDEAVKLRLRKVDSVGNHALIDYDVI
jgi:riboflavin-specific deaminase-like protein